MHPTRHRLGDHRGDAGFVRHRGGVDHRGAAGSFDLAHHRLGGRPVCPSAARPKSLTTTLAPRRPAPACAGPGLPPAPVTIPPGRRDRMPASFPLKVRRGLSRRPRVPRVSPGCVRLIMVNIHYCLYTDPQPAPRATPCKAIPTIPAGCSARPEGFIDKSGVRTVFAEARRGRRDFLRSAFAAAVAGASAAAAQSNRCRPTAATRTSSICPSTARASASRWPPTATASPRSTRPTCSAAPSPGSTQTSAGLGVVRAAAVAVRHRHAGRAALRAPSPGLVGHRPVEAPPHAQRLRPSLLKKAMVFTMDELMRLPSVSRFHFIECGANTGMEWGNVAVPTVQYTHGMISCSEFTGVPLRILLDMAGVDYQARTLRARRGRRRLVDDAHHPDGTGRVGRGAGRLRPERRDAAPETATRCAWWCRACRA